MAAQRTTLKAIAQETGVSYKTIRKIYGLTGAPAMTAPLREHRRYVRQAATGTVKLPKDLADQLVLIKFERAKHVRDKEKELAEEKRMKNLATRGKLVEREEIRAHGAAFGIAFSSALAGFEKDGPALCVGKGERELATIFRDLCDRLRLTMREAVARLEETEAAAPAHDQE
jgi:hypothetical protein